MVDDAANEVGVDRDEFGEYIHELKEDFHMRPKDNFTYDELIGFARELKEILGD